MIFGLFVLCINTLCAQITEKEFFDIQENEEFNCTWISCVNDSSFEFESDTIEFRRFENYVEDTCCYMVKWNFYSELSGALIDYSIRCDSWSDMNIMAVEEVNIIQDQAVSYVLVYRDEVLEEQYFVKSYSPSEETGLIYDRLILIKIK